jgi:hypothetical protein
MTCTAQSAEEILAKSDAQDDRSFGDLYRTTDWRDISLAARDGSEVLVWNGRRRHVAHFDKIEGEWVSSFKTTTKRLVVAPPPTHWSPLPPEPNVKEINDDE